jgi:hypothetical protein
MILFLAIAIIVYFIPNTLFGDFTFSAAAVVPVPAAIWLFGFGLLGLIGIARRKKAA